MTFDEAVKYIYQIPKFTTKNDSIHTKTFLRHLGNPEKKLKVLHVAGTNGKGSVCIYLDTLLRSQGKTVGRFTSPHLVRINERIVMENQEISNEEFLNVFRIVLNAVRKMEQAGDSHPTFFEFLFAMAVTAFARAEVEYAVLETGLGGRLDATNAVERPAASIITAIGLDHTQYLGNTLTEIAGEKAGIIKPGVPVFYAEAENDTNINEVIEYQAAQMGAACHRISKDEYKILGIENKHIAFSTANAYYGNTTWYLANTGIYQPHNAMLALAVMQFLFGEAGQVDLWREALGKVRWAGRMEEVLPGIYLDGAHNVSAVAGFIESLPDDGTGKIILFSAVKDKDYESMIDLLCQKSDVDFYIITRIPDERAVPADELKAVFEKYTDKPIIVRESPQDAFAYLREHQDKREAYCLGSLYLAGIIKSIL